MLVTSFGIPAPAYAGDLLLLYRSASDTEYLFDLENHSTHEILFRGLKSLWSRVIPVDTAYSCRNKSTGVGNVSAFPLMEGEEPSHINVSTPAIPSFPP
jgi:hypothetical protein